MTTYFIVTLFAQAALYILSLPLAAITTYRPRPPRRRQQPVTRRWSWTSRYGDLRQIEGEHLVHTVGIRWRVEAFYCTTPRSGIRKGELS